MANLSRLASYWHGAFAQRRICIGFTLALVAVSFFQGCASFVAGPGLTASTPNAIPAKFFTLKGRISVRVADRLETGKMHWTKLPGEERVQLFTPFGSQVAELVTTADGLVTLQRGAEKTTAISLGELTKPLLGVSLDMVAVAAWTQGIGLKDSEESDRQFANGEVWRVSAERYQSQGPHQFVSRLSAIRGDTVVRLVIDEWRAQ